MVHRPQRERSVALGENRRFNQHSLAWYDARQPNVLGAVSALHAKNDVHEALHVSEPLRIQVVGHLDVFVPAIRQLSGVLPPCRRSADDGGP
jgi:hypothetical protein